MKKTISMLLIISLLLSSTLVLTGCNGDSKKIIGSWQAEIDYAAAVNAGISSVQGAAKMAEYIKFDSFPLLTTFTFHEDGTYTVTMDPSSVFNAVQNIRTHVAMGMLEYVEDMLKEKNIPMTVNEYLAFLGLNRLTLGQTLVSDRALAEMAEELNKGSTGLYRIEKGKIYMTASTDEELTEENYDTYTLDGDTLTLLECHCKQEEGFENISQDIYPVVLTRTEE